ncbi:MAG: FMN-binding protein [Omnitrophica bacterium]|nr:FMN-binding protein [Candidatus Omnitrophota bacterium]
MPDNKLIKNRLWMIALIIIVSSISAGLLTLVNAGTKQRIAFNVEIKLKRSVLDVFAIPYEKSEIINIFNNRIEIGKINNRTVYRYYERGKLSGLAFKMKGAGFWGPISALMALEPELEKIKGIIVLHQEETPGLGGRITEAEFINQFPGRPVFPEVSVDAITGATMTSNAFKRIINENVQSFREEFQKK